MSSSFKIGDFLVGRNSPPFIIAEMSGNHNQSLERALHIVDKAAESGVHAIKLQTYKPDTITMDINSPSFNISDNKSIWNGKNLYKLYEEAQTPWEWHLPIMERAKSLGLLCFSSPFDESAVDFLDSLDVPAFKIASFENNHLPLIAKAANTGKPLIISTGMATVAELDEAVSTARKNGCENLLLLKCTSTYPASPLSSNIRTIPHLRDLFNVQVGLSDHTGGIGVSVASVAMGATVIEKHFTLSRSDGGVDSSFSLEPHEFSSLVVETRRAWESLGEVSYGATHSEFESIKFRRSIYVSNDIHPGDVFSTDNLKIIRPGDGAKPSLLSSFLGLKSNKFIQRGTPLSIEHLL